MLFISYDEKAVGREKGNNDCVRDAIAYCCALLRSTLRYYRNQITPCEKEKKGFSHSFSQAGTPYGVKPSTAANTKGAEWQILN
jgi:hypothetical protein